ncbi:hypothetical protein P171DRAFT_437657 [Karstenula rhodostoma CBS 690.94]|uniref:Uncharacterized protein n=1 Tax=Karstenula rhodostoma CBS 690.94 TaxID=1392251 RepID=A0A9P4P5G4_9PLEO|nr:hypothetical protein P171DRAFT_437657 [Karstenula rhodostoma CBS 690.94]
MASAALDPRILRSSPAHKVTEHLRDVFQNSSEESITREILNLIEIDSIAPAAFAQWLGIAQLPETLRAALTQTASIQVRRFAFKKLKKSLSGVQWQETWDALGGVSGWLSLLSEFSVQDVKEACHVLARSAKGADIELKRERITRLFIGILPQLFPDESSDVSSNKDRRQLRTTYQRLIPAGTSDVVSDIVTKHWNAFKEHRYPLLLSHAETLQGLAMRYVFGNHPAGEIWLSPLLSRYPNATTTIPGVSASMQFSLKLLERLTNEDVSASMEKDMVIKELAEPLLKRALKKKIYWSLTQHIVDLCLLYLNRHPDIAETLDMQRGSFVCLVGRCWSSKSDMFTDQFERILALPFAKIEKEQMFSTLVRVGLLGVWKPRRYALLRFYCQCLYQCDLDNEADIKAAELPPLTNTLLNSVLSSEDALSLFTRIRSAKGGYILVDRGPYFYGDSDDSTSVDVDMWHALLLFRSSRHSEAAKVARQCFEARKIATESSAVQERRAANARSAVDFATLSGSLELYMEAHQWARRFVRDPLTACQLYRTTNREGMTLLSGIPRYLNKTMSLSELRNRVEYANNIMLYMFETTCIALREPSFNKLHFRGVLALFASIVRERMIEAARLKKYVRMSDEEVYHVLWADTLKLLLTVEEKGLSPGHEALSLNTVRGVLNYPGNAHVDLKDEAPPTLRFFDELAEARDALWKKHRLSAYPATTALPAPFPQGLPVQHLTEPYILSLHTAQSGAPYIAARINAAVFPERRAALVPFPEDQEIREAIGVFVDDYIFALRVFTPNWLNKEERTRCAHEAWSYAVGPLSEGRFTSDEADRYWSTGETWDSVFPKSWHEAFNTKLPDWPLVPDVEHPGKIEEWDPNPAMLKHVSEKKLGTVTYIDVSKQLLGRSNNATVSTRLQLVDPVIPAASHTPAFSLTRIHQAKANPAIREGQIMLALLYIDNLLLKLRLLSIPFPDAAQGSISRYPAVYVDGEFLSRTSLEHCRDADVFSFLGAHLTSVPPSLLAQAAYNAYEALNTTRENESGYVDLEHRTFGLVRLLIRCDRPTLASNLVVRIVLDRPQNSSWHRLLLSRSFLHRLPAAAAQDCVSTFSKAIISRIKQQAATHTNSSSAFEPDQSTEKIEHLRGSVKVTTAKLLAELLGDTACLPEQFTLSILSELVNNATHVDIRCAALSSLLDLLRFVSFEKTDKILTALQIIIPIAGNLRERRLITGAEWAHAENTLELPELDDQGSLNESAPMLWSLFSFLNSNPPGCSQFLYQAAFVTRIILPVITSLKYQTAKWTSLFLKKQGFDFAAQQDLDIPQIPRDQQILYELLRCAAPFLPISFLDEFVAHCTFNIAPPKDIAKLNKRLREDVTATSDPTSREWLARYALGMDVSGRSFQVTSLLDRYANNSLTGEITTKAVQAAYLKLYTVILLHDTENLKGVHREQRLLWPYSPSSKIDKSWEIKYKPLVEAIIMYVESLHTREWERDPNRRPPVLPNTFVLRTHLLQYAAQYSDHPPNSDEHCAAFATRVAKLTDQISNGLYHHKFLELKASLKYVQGDNRLRVACLLGDISKTRLSWLTLRDHLRVELAASLLYDGTREGGRRDALSEKVEALRQSWRASESEEVRKVGFRQWVRGW